MRSVFKLRILGEKLEDLPAVVTESVFPSQGGEATFFKTIGWVAAGTGALALGLFVGRELRQRYKFTRRTPYDVYSHAGDQMHDVEFGVGI